MVLGEIASVLGVPSLREVKFRTLQSGFHIENGWLSFDGLDLVDPDARWHLDGRMGFDGALDYHVTIVLSKALADRALAKLGDVARFLVTAQGELPVDLKITGSVTKPNVSVDLSGVAGRAEDAALREAARQVGGAIGVDGRAISKPESVLKEPGTIGDIIGGIFGRKKKTPATPPATAPAATPSSPSTPAAPPPATPAAPDTTATPVPAPAPRDTPPPPPPKFAPTPPDTARPDTTSHRPSPPAAP